MDYSWFLRQFENFSHDVNIHLIDDFARRFGFRTRLVTQREITHADGFVTTSLELHVMTRFGQIRGGIAYARLQGITYEHPDWVPPDGFSTYLAETQFFRNNSVTRDLKRSRDVFEGRGMYEKPLRPKRKLFPWEPIDDEHEDPTQKDSDDEIEFSGLTQADDFIRNYDEDQIVYPRTIQRTKRKLVFRQPTRRTAVRLNEERGERVERDFDILSPEEEYEVVYG